MQDHLDDAMLRYDFARNNLAAVDRSIVLVDLKAHLHNAGHLADDRLRGTADLLHELADLSEKFADAARALAAALDDDRSVTTERG